MDILRQFHVEAERHLKKIEELCGPEYKLTLVARYTGSVYDDADIVLSCDDLTKVESCIRWAQTKDKVR